MTEIKDSRSLQAAINITPLVDVVLVLLIIFMVLTPLLLKEFSVIVPDSSRDSEKEHSANASLLLALKADGGLKLLNISLGGTIHACEIGCNGSMISRN